MNHTFAEEKQIVEADPMQVLQTARQCIIDTLIDNMTTKQASLHALLKTFDEIEELLASQSGKTHTILTEKQKLICGLSQGFEILCMSQLGFGGLHGSQLFDES